jgi:hypothetical protein
MRRDISWYDWIDGEPDDLREARRQQGCPRLTATQLEALWQLRMTVWDGYLISKGARNELVDLGLVDRCAGWQVITCEGLAVLDTYGLLKDDRYGTSGKAGRQLWALKPEQFARLREAGWLR